MASWEILKNMEILENIPALISHKMCLTDGKLRCAIKIGSDSITELVPMHSRVRKMESQCDNYKYIWQIQIQIRLFITKHALEFAKNGKPEWLLQYHQLGYSHRWCAYDHIHVCFFSAEKAFPRLSEERLVQLLTGIRKHWASRRPSSQTGDRGRRWAAAVVDMRSPC